MLKGSDGWSVLLIAINKSHLQFAWYLVHHGAELDVTSAPLLFRLPLQPTTYQASSDESALTLAVEKGYLELAQHLVNEGVDMNPGGNSALLRAVDHGREEIVRYLVSRGVDLNVLGRENRSAHGADIKQDDLYSEFALKRASEMGDLEMARKIVEQGADTNVLVTNGQLEIVQYLVSNGADPTLRDSGGRSLMMLARERGHSELVTYLADFPI
ncbi:ankyrin repeat-containing domain protein [Flagelloscypha sp. PMI_526]|nr:ankyrin repeat-containing domain protein [Flagelloscypha sp. PMI_526]